MKDNYSTIIHFLSTRLNEPLPGRAAQERMLGRVVPMPATVPQNARLSAVLCLLYPIDNELHLVLMRRNEDKTAHSGQVSFPGGRKEPYDDTLMATALREAEEEIGINKTHVQLLGALTPIYIPVSNYNVFPYIGFSNTKPEFKPSANEVAHVLEIPLSLLFHKNKKTITDVISPASKIKIKNVNAYQLSADVLIWGATAMILSELEVLLEGVNTSNI